MTTIVGARVFDAVSGRTVETTVTIHDGLVHALGQEPDDTVLDGTGATLLPGLIDCHTHLCATATPDIIAQMTGDSPTRATLHAARNARAHLNAGVTTVRDCGALHGIAIELARAIDDGLVEGARVQAAGLVITMTGGHGHFLGREVDGVDEVRKATRQAAKEGAGFVKVMSTGGLLTPGVTAGRTAFAPDELKVLVYEAHNAGLRVATHAIGNEGIKNALRAGVDSVEHGFYLDDEAIELLLARDDVYLVPTLAGVECALAHGDELAPWLRAKSRAVVEDRAESFRRAYEAGVKFAAGTDAGTPFNRHGGLREELALMADIGLSPGEALIAATRHAAANLGLTDRIGTIEVGKVADLILVEGDPLTDLGALRKVRQVIQAGVPRPPAVPR
ncbi:amidohydrolase [Asanoa ishikariensis]|uniref:Imidazolonepropionase n=1 Tax=Asanoa ishikariensis TaxID=137265 RepID=A0A1H3TFQ8_9ACTN|nr:amidohydrolase family protein [Asanoa ishikariensis]GIF62598.1 amidohydrolase [Asanoa ishikariensis]SDZ48505.1 Imidazolonepropionase [Asanoa ishikariensis]